MAMKSKSESVASSLNLSIDKKNSLDDTIKPTYPTWSSRLKCQQAYICLIANFITVMRYCNSLGIYGSAILLPYFLFKLILGLPVIFAELTLGRYVTGSIGKILDMCPFEKGAFVCSFVISYVNVLLKAATAVYMSRYLWSIMSGSIKWDSCEQSWATVNCYAKNDNVSSMLKCLKNNTEEFCDKRILETSGKEFLRFEMLNMFDPAFTIHYVVSLFVIFLITITLNMKGIRSFEKLYPLLLWVPLGLAILLATLIFTIHNSQEGFSEIWEVKEGVFGKADIWVRGLDDTLLTLNIGLLAIPFISSHGLFVDDIAYDALTVFFSDIFVSLILTVPTLSVIKAVNPNKNVFKLEMDSFIWITESLLYYPQPQILWAFLYFAHMFLLDLGSQFIVFLAVFDTIMELLKNRYNAWYVLVGCAVVVTITTVPVVYFFIFIYNSYVSMTLISVLLELLTIEVFYGLRKFNDNFHFMMGYHLHHFFTWMQVIALLVAAAAILCKVILKIPHWEHPLSIYLSNGIPLAIYIIAGFIEICKAYKKGNIRSVFRDNPDWGPSIPLLKTSRVVFDSKTVTKEFMYRKELHKKPLMKPNEFRYQNIVHMKV